MKLFFILAIASIQFSFAAPQGKILKLKGAATYNDVALKEGEIITGKGIIKVSDKSIIRFRYEDAGHDVLVGGNSELTVDFAQPKGGENVTLVQGVSRWISGKIQKPRESAGIKTKSATMGVRGTDFIVMVNQLLDESEVICFEGQVSLTNNRNKADHKDIHKGQWGGVGGRYGKRIGDIIDLPENILKHFDSSLAL